MWGKLLSYYICIFTNDYLVFHSKEVLLIMWLRAFYAIEYE